MKNMKLGRGLDALMGEIDEAYENESSSKDSITEIPLKDITPNPYQPRKHFDENAIQELANSIKTDGLIQPIVVTQDVDGYTIIAGERRVRASKYLKLKTIRAIILSADAQKMRQLAVIENIQRENLNAVELAWSYSKLLKMYGVTQEELAVKIHKSRTHITNTIRLLQLSEKTQKSLVEKKITAGHAKVLVGLDDKQQQLMVNSIVGQKLSVREVESVIKSMKDSSTTTKQTTDSIEYDISKVIELLKITGFKAKSSKNKLTIEFNSQKQIQELQNLLSI